MLVARDQLERFRAAIDDEQSGQAFEELQHMLVAGSLPITSGIEPPLKTGPRGYPSDHPRTEFLRWKGATIVQEYDRAAWAATRSMDISRSWLGTVHRPISTLAYDCVMLIFVRAGSAIPR